MKDRSFRFSHAIARKPGLSVASGLRIAGDRDPDPARFVQQHEQYVKTLEALGATVTVLPALEAFPDSVFVEDAAVCAGACAIVMRPGAPSRQGEEVELRNTLDVMFSEVFAVPGPGTIDGGDVLLTETEALVGLSERTDSAGYQAFARIIEELGYRARRVDAPAEVLHFKSDCGLLDAETIFATSRLAATGCFAGYRVIEAPVGEEAAANLIRFNDAVIMRSGFPKTEEILNQAGYQVITMNSGEAALVDGGLSCMSLRFTL